MEQDRSAEHGVVYSLPVWAVRPQAALDELDKLKPVCVDSGMTWEERTARREQEISSLKEALRILGETDFR